MLRTRVVRGVSSGKSYTRGGRRPRTADDELGAGWVELGAEGAAGGVKGEELVTQQVATGGDIGGNGYGPGVLFER